MAYLWVLYIYTVCGILYNITDLYHFGIFVHL